MFVLQRMLAADHKSKLKSLYFVSSLFQNFTVLLPPSINFPLVTPHHCLIDAPLIIQLSPILDSPCSCSLCNLDLVRLRLPSLTSLCPICTVLLYFSSHIGVVAVTHLSLTYDFPKLYPVLSALSLVVFEYDEVHKLGFQVSFC